MRLLRNTGVPPWPGAARSAPAASGKRRRLKPLLLALLLTLPVAAQETAPAAGESGQAVSPAVEQWLSGHMEAGYRWVSDVSGDFNTYRSVVNLGEGPKLLGLDFTVRNASRKLFDTMTVRGSSWGGDPYNTARVEVGRDGSYKLSFDYRNISYFNFLPSFANPFVQRGVLLDQRSFDLQRRLIDTELELLPGRKIVPFIAYSRDWGNGSGITDFVTDGNEYPVANTLRDKTDHFRGGVRIELKRFHATLEQGATRFKDDQSVFNAERQNGNRTTPVLGQQLFLTDLLQAYRVRGDSRYSKGLVTANPASWLNVYGQLLYGQPSSDVEYNQRNAGRFVAFRPPIAGLRFFDLQQSLLASEAKQPHTSGSLAAELRPHRRVRVMESLMTDRFHTTASALAEDSFTVTTPDNASTLASTQLLPGLERLVFNYNRQEANLLVDVTERFTLRGGHRYVWGDSEVRAPQLSQSGPQEAGRLKMHAGLAGVSLRPADRLNIQADFEAGSADRNYFRTSLQDYRKLKARVRYQALNSLSFAAAFALLSNENPATRLNYDFLSRDNSLSVFWTPGGGKRFSLTGDYTRSTLRSDLLYLDPLGFSSLQSSYRENAHIASGVVDLTFPNVNQAAPKLSLGGSLYRSMGSRPAQYYQPLVKFAFPVHRKVFWFAEWRWYQLAQPLYLYEGFRTHQFIAGLRLAL